MDVYASFREQYLKQQLCLPPLRGALFYKLARGMNIAIERCFTCQNDFSIDKPLADFISKLSECVFLGVKTYNLIPNSLAMFFADTYVREAAKATVLFWMSICPKQQFDRNISLIIRRSQENFKSEHLLNFENFLPKK
jgi:hypothetical protein